MKMAPFRCKKCGSMVGHVLTTVAGSQILKCLGQLSTIPFNDINPRLVPCGLIYNQKGQPIPAATSLPYNVEGRTKYVGVKKLLQ